MSTSVKLEMISFTEIHVQCPQKNEFRTDARGYSYIRLVRFTSEEMYFD